MIPGQVAGTTVVYGVVANDVLRDVLIINGSYSVKESSILNASLARAEVMLGENITVKGSLTQAKGGVLSRSLLHLETKVKRSCASRFRTGHI
jgi:hypothetical protein